MIKTTIFSNRNKKENLQLKIKNNNFNHKNNLQLIKSFSNQIISNNIEKKIHNLKNEINLLKQFTNSKKKNTHFFSSNNSRNVKSAKQKNNNIFTNRYSRNFPQKNFINVNSNYSYHITGNEITTNNLNIFIASPTKKNKSSLNCEKKRKY